MLEQDSHAKVTMRSKIRSLRAIEREVLEQQTAAPEGPTADSGGCEEPPASQGLAEVEALQEQLRGDVGDVQKVEQTLAPASGSSEQRQQQFDALQQAFSLKPDAVYEHMAKVMASFQAGLFAGGDSNLAQDNLDLERFFRLPKGHERRIHGHWIDPAMLPTFCLTLVCAL